MYGVQKSLNFCDVISVPKEFKYNFRQLYIHQTKGNPTETLVFLGY